MSAAADAPRPAWPTIAGLVVLTATLTVVAGPLGAVAGLATAIAWYALGTPYALAAGHVVLAIAFTDGIDPRTLAIVELAFVVFVASSVVRAATLRGDVAAVTVTSGTLVGVAWFVGRSRPLWIGASALLLVFALASYTLHRYELVRLGLVPDDRSTDSRTPDT